MKKWMLFIAILMIILQGCGEGASSNPTARISSLKADPTEVAPGGSALITASVLKTGGQVTGEAKREAGREADTTTVSSTTTVGPIAWGVNVSFKLLTSNGGKLSTTTAKTDGSGTASVVYTAGNNYSQDVIEAWLENGNSALLIVKKAGSPPGISIKITNPSASPATVKTYGYQTITAQVTDNSTGAAQPVSGETVEFTLIENGSGGSVKVQSAVTDAGGNATALYQAGGNYSTTDVVQAKLLATGSVSTVIINVTGTTPSGPAVTVSASSTSVVAGGQSLITVKVTDGTSPVVGAYVEIWIEPNKSGASLIVPNHVTDAAGQVVATYLCGTQSIQAQVSDTVQAKSGNSTGAVVITRSGSSSGYSVTVTAMPSSLSSGTGQSTVTANVTNNSTGTPVSGIAVTFSVSGTGNGKVDGQSSSTKTTNGSGNAVTTYQANAGAGSSYDTITATAQIDSGTYTGQVTISIVN